MTNSRMMKAAHRDNNTSLNNEALPKERRRRRRQGAQSKRKLFTLPSVNEYLLLVLLLATKSNCGSSLVTTETPGTIVPSLESTLEGTFESSLGATLPPDDADFLHGESSATFDPTATVSDAISYVPTRQPSRKPTTEPTVTNSVEADSEWPLVSLTSEPTLMPSEVDRSDVDEGPMIPLFSPTVTPTDFSLAEGNLDTIMDVKMNATMPTMAPSLYKKTTIPTSNPESDSTPVPTQVDGSIRQDTPGPDVVVPLETTEAPTFEFPTTNSSVTNNTSNSTSETGDETPEPVPTPFPVPDQELVPAPVVSDPAPAPVASDPQPAPVPAPEPNPAPVASDTAPLPAPAPEPQPEPDPPLLDTEAPTFKPTSRPTAKPTPDPTESPTESPTRKPTRWPTRTPTESPTSKSPTNPPTEEPTSAPTEPPTLYPTPNPTRYPTIQPAPVVGPTTSSPTSNPSEPPTGRPTRNPTDEPTSCPSTTPTITEAIETMPPTTSEPSDQPSNVPSWFPTVSNAPTTETRSPTFSPAPSDLPSLTPTDLPSPMPSEPPTSCPSMMPTMGPSESPSQAPSLPLQNEGESVVMTLRYSSVLEGLSIITWEQITATHILNYMVASGIDPPMDDLRVATNIVRQTPELGLDDADAPAAAALLGPAVESSEAPAVAPKSAPTVRRRRSLQQATTSTLTPLKIEFYTAVSYRSSGKDHNIQQLISGAFDTDEDREAYINSLKRTNDAAFQYLEDIESVSVGGKVIPEDETGKGTTGRDMTIFIIIGSCAGGGALLLLILFCIWRRHVSKKQSSAGGRTEIASTAMNASSNANGVTTEIFVENQGDDVSTLGEPLYTGNQGGGGMMLNTLMRDEQTASVGDDYDYKYLKHHNFKNGGDPTRPRIMSEDTRSRMMSEEGRSESDQDLTRGSSSKTGMKSALGLSQMGESIFSDDASFEEQFTETEDQVPFEITAPPGKLGMVIDTPNGGFPIVHAIKDTSILADKVRVGDRLVSVDGEDCTAMTAVQVSKLISLKSEQAKRVLVFVRSKTRPTKKRS